MFHVRARLRARRRTRAAAVAIAAALAAASVSACDTWAMNEGNCSGAVTIKAGGGLITAVAGTQCAGTPPTQFTLALYIYADNQIVAQTESSVIPDNSGYNISVTAICLPTTYRAVVAANAMSDAGIWTAKAAQMSLTIKAQGDCR